MKSNQVNMIDVTQLQVGLYVHLDLGWMDHPFTLSNFKLKDETQIAIIKKTGLKQLRYDPNRSDCKPLPIAEVLSEETQTADNHQADEIAAGISAKHTRLKALHQAINENEKKFLIASNVARYATRNILTASNACLEQADALVNDMVDTALTEGDIAIHALNGNRSSDESYLHSLNVTVLALMMAKSTTMTKGDARILGMAALFHDIGKAEVTDRVLMKKEPLNQAEQLHFEEHCVLGARMAKEAGLPVTIARIILQHHECADGSGYPKKLKSEETDPLAQLLAVVNTYDNLCNPSNPVHAKTPYEALAYMYAQQSTKFDEYLLKRLIKSLGIYPPGSIVQLSTGAHAIVISCNPNKPLRPFVLLHEPTVKRNEPLILDLREEPNINISGCLRPNQLPQEAFHYLNPRNKVNYFIDAEILQE